MCKGQDRFLQSWLLRPSLIGMAANRNVAQMDMRKIYLFENVALSLEWHFSLRHFVKGRLNKSTKKKQEAREM